MRSPDRTLEPEPVIAPGSAVPPEVEIVVPVHNEERDLPPGVRHSDSFGGGSGGAAQITAWVKAHFTATTVGGETVYDLAGR